MKKLHKAAITLPAEPRPISFSFNANVCNYGLCSIRAIQDGSMESGLTMAGNNAFCQSLVNRTGSSVDKQIRGNGADFTKMAKSTNRLSANSVHQIECGLMPSDV